MCVCGGVGVGVESGVLFVLFCLCLAFLVCVVFQYNFLKILDKCFKR